MKIIWKDHKKRHDKTKHTELVEKKEEIKPTEIKTVPEIQAYMGISFSVPENIKTLSMEQKYQLLRQKRNEIDKVNTNSIQHDEFMNRLTQYSNNVGIWDDFYYSRDAQDKNNQATSVNNTNQLSKTVVTHIEKVQKERSKQETRHNDGEQWRTQVEGEKVHTNKSKLNIRI